MPLITAYDIKKIINQLKADNAHKVLTPRNRAEGDKFRTAHWYNVKGSAGRRYHPMHCQCGQTTYRVGWQVRALQTLGEGCASITCAYTSKFVKEIMNPVNLTLAAQWKYILLQDPSDVTIFWGGTLFAEKPVCTEQYGLELYQKDLRSRAIHTDRKHIWLEKKESFLPWDKDNLQVSAERPEGLYTLPPKYIRYHDEYVTIEKFAEQKHIPVGVVIQCLGSSVYSDEVVAELLPNEEHRTSVCLDIIKQGKHPFGGL